MILIDDRDGSKDLLDMPILEGHCSPTRIEFPVGDNGKDVPCGDAMVTGHGPNGTTLRVGVELKSVDDLLSSISVGRLGGTQIPRMVKAFDIVVVLSFGVYRCGPFNHLQVFKWNRKLKRNTWATYEVGGKAVPYSYLEGFMMTAMFKTMLESGKPLFFKHVYDIAEAAAWLRLISILFGR